MPDTAVEPHLPADCGPCSSNEEHGSSPPVPAAVSTGLSREVSASGALASMRVNTSFAAALGLVAGVGAFLLTSRATGFDDPVGDGSVIAAMTAAAFLATRRVASRVVATQRIGRAQTALIVGAGDVGQLI